MDSHHIPQWLGKEQISQATLSAATANLMQSTLNREPTFEVGDELPPAWHWLYFHEPIRTADLGVEGHPQLGAFMPPVDFGTGEAPRRMWASGALTFLQPLRLGDWATRRSTIKAITPKTGRSGRLLFVVVAHEVAVNGALALREEQTIVYREPSHSAAEPAKTERAAAEPAAPISSDFSAQYQPDPTLLFRYSALTFNAHRIHYDVDFCRHHEGYPDLVVHGPLVATLLLDLFYQRFAQRRIARFEYRGLSPLFHPHPFTVHGRTDGQAWAANHTGEVTMTAQLFFET